MSYVLMFFAGALFSVAVLLSLIGHVGMAVRDLLGVAGLLFMAWICADSTTERKS